MPIYEYDCNSCKEAFSIIQLSSSAKEKVTCPKCKSSDVTKKISSFSCSAPGGFGGGFSGGG